MCSLDRDGFIGCLPGAVAPTDGNSIRWNCFSASPPTKTVSERMTWVASDVSLWLKQNRGKHRSCLFWRESYLTFVWMAICMHTDWAYYQSRLTSASLFLVMHPTCIYVPYAVLSSRYGELGHWGPAFGVEELLTRENYLIMNVVVFTKSSIWSEPHGASCQGLRIVQ